MKLNTQLSRSVGGYCFAKSPCGAVLVVVDMQRDFCTPGGALKHALRMEAVLAHAGHCRTEIARLEIIAI